MFAEKSGPGTAPLLNSCRCPPTGSIPSPTVSGFIEARALTVNLMSPYIH